MRKLAIHTLLVVALLLGFATHSVAQKSVRFESPTLEPRAEFATYFDNKEYASVDNSLSGTIFSARLTPKLALCWDTTPEGDVDNPRSHEVVLGADMFQDFGHDSKFLSDINVQMYYKFENRRVEVDAGIFPRSRMRGLRSTLFFDHDYRYYNNRIQGVYARYGSDSYVEFAMDYDGMRSYERRESFMIMSSARKYILGPQVGFGDMHLGYDFLMGHYAKDYNPNTADGVVDNLMLTPLIGYTHTFDLGYRKNSNLRRPNIYLLAEAKYILSMQRDRLHENVWRTEQGVEILVEAGCCGAILRNRLYLGDNLLTHYNRYGGNVYHGSPLYATTKGIYNTIEVGYRSTLSFFIDLEAGVTIDYDGRGWGTRQYIALCIDLWPGIKLRK